MLTKPSSCPKRITERVGASKTRQPLVLSILNLAENSARGKCLFYRCFLAR